MRFVEKFTCALLVVTVSNAAVLAQSLGVDWKVFGFTSLDKEGGCVNFYDARGAVKKPDGHIRVWTKCLLQKDLDKIDFKNDVNHEVLDSAANRVRLHYVPPIATVQSIDADQRMNITLYEVVANVGHIQPNAEIFYELDCSERMLRELSVHIEDNSGSRSTDKPMEWKYVSPESKGGSLLKLVCPLS